MNVFEEIDRREHEQILFCSDRKVRLRTIIAVSPTTQMTQRKITHQA